MTGGQKGGNKDFDTLEIALMMADIFKRLQIDGDILDSGKMLNYTLGAEISTCIEWLSAMQHYSFSLWGQVSVLFE